VMHNGWLDMFRFVVERSSYSVRISIHLDLMSLTWKEQGWNILFWVNFFGGFEDMRF
jgi:hypothetical protein